MLKGQKTEEERQKHKEKKKKKKAKKEKKKEEKEMTKADGKKVLREEDDKDSLESIEVTSEEQVSKHKNKT